MLRIRSNIFLSQTKVPEMLLVMLAAALLLVSGCTRAVEYRERLVSAEEIAVLRAEVDELAQANQTRSCLRPVLRGTAVPGSAEDDLIALVEGADDTRACLKMLRHLAQEEHVDWSNGFLAGLSNADTQSRLWRSPLPPASPLADDSLPQQISEACAPVRLRLRAAGARKDACSPYLPGRRCSPESLIVLLDLAKAVAAMAWLHVSRAELRPAAELLLDTLRFTQDLERGGSSLIYVAMGGASTNFLAGVLELVVNSSTAQHTDLLAELEAQLTLLLSTEPHPHTFIEAEYLTFVLDMVLPKLEPGEAFPPGYDFFWSAATSRSREGKASDRSLKTLGADQRDDMAMAWLASAEIFRDRVAACPATSTPRACREAVTELHAGYAKAVGANESGWPIFNRLEGKMLVAMFREGDPHQAFRQTIVKVLKATVPNLASHFLSQSRRRFLLASARLAVAYRRLAFSRGSCPGPAEMAAELGEYGADPDSGLPMTVTVSDTGALLLAPSAGYPVDKRGAMLFKVSCPNHGQEMVPEPGLDTQIETDH